jgi:hypothetical protein
VGKFREMKTRPSLEKGAEARGYRVVAVRF